MAHKEEFAKDLSLSLAAFDCIAVVTYTLVNSLVATRGNDKFISDHPNQKIIYQRYDYATVVLDIICFLVGAIISFIEVYYRRKNLSVHLSNMNMRLYSLDSELIENMTILHKIGAGSFGEV